MRILIVNFGTRDSLGCLALLEGNLNILREAWPDSSIKVLSSEREDSILGIPVEKSIITPRNGIHGKIGNVCQFLVLTLGMLCIRSDFLLKAYRSLFPREAAFLSEYRESDLIVDTGGDVLTEDYGLYSLALCVSHLAIGLALRRKVILLGETIGPFSGFVRKTLLKQFLNRVTLIMVRESWTRDYLTGDLGIDEVKLCQMPDPSFSIAVPHDEQIDRSSLPVCLVPSALTWRYFKGAQERPDQTYSDYIAFLGRVVRLFDTDIGAKVVIAPHVRGSWQLNDDLGVCLDLMEEIKDSSEVKLNDGLSTSDAVRGFLARCQFLVTFRMHAGLAGYATGVPTFFVSYSQKFFGMTTDISGSSRWSIDVRGEDLNEQWVSRTLHRIRECWDVREDERQTISHNLEKNEAAFAEAIRSLKSAAAAH